MLSGNGVEASEGMDAGGAWPMEAKRTRSRRSAFLARSQKLQYEAEKIITASRSEAANGRNKKERR